jgi:hypothetical protein
VADQPDHLDVLADELLALSMPGLAYGSDRARWERNARGVIARIFRLGTAAGWDKAVAAQDGPEPARPGTAGPALVKESEIALLAEQLTEVASAVVRLQSRLARGGYPRRVALAELAQAGECLETAATGLRES